jgi:hypothetical protein
MARRMVVAHDGGDTQLVEVLAHDELQLQDRVKHSPELLPVDELGLREPLMVVGRETTLASGAADLLAVTPDGDVLVIEFKTGPQNPDFRSALAQLLDYGSDLWKMTYDEFESGVAVRYFQGSHCPPKSPTRGLNRLRAAAAATWPDFGSDELDAFQGRLAEALLTGAFHYIVVAQAFTGPMQATAEYLNALASPARFYLVELVRFAGGELNAFEARTILKPDKRRAQSTAAATSENVFLESIDDPDYRASFERFFEACRALNLRFEWGTRGTSIRLLVPDRPEPVSIAWAFPPSTPGWMGLTDTTFGYDPSLQLSPDTHSALSSYATRIGAIHGAETVNRAGLKAFTFAPARLIEAENQIVELLAVLANEMGGKG